MDAILTIMAGIAIGYITGNIVADFFSTDTSTLTNIRLKSLEDMVSNLEKDKEQLEEEVMELQICLYGIEDEEGEEFKGLIKKVNEIEDFQDCHSDSIFEMEEVLYGEDLDGKGLIETVYEHIFGAEDKSPDCEVCKGNLENCKPELCTKPTLFAFEDTDLEPHSTSEEAVIPSLLKDRVELAKVIEQANCCKGLSAESKGGIDN